MKASLWETLAGLVQFAIEKRGAGIDCIVLSVEIGIKIGILRTTMNPTFAYEKPCESLLKRR